MINGPLLNYPAKPHHRDPIRDPSDGRDVMGDEHVAQPEFSLQ